MRESDILLLPDDRLLDQRDPQPRDGANSLEGHQAGTCAAARALGSRRTGLACARKGTAWETGHGFTRWRVAIFVDGCFWHGHPDFFTPGKSGAYWDAKIARTQERDRLANEALLAAGWIVIRLWDFEVEQGLEECVFSIVRALDASRGRPGSASPAHTGPRPAVFGS
jgi:DNA mismatch endonuclease (patch repair protein)